jgi:hypothetical protein
MEMLKAKVSKKMKCMTDVEYTVPNAFKTSNHDKTENKAGSLKHHKAFWKSITNDKKILKLISGYEIEFDSIPVQSSIPRPYKFPAEKSEAITFEIQNMLDKKVIEKTCLENVLFVSNIFTREKADGSLRIILDLTELNEYITYHKFKMENLQTALNLVSRNCYMASIDWSNAYYSVPVGYESRKFLAFQWEGQIYQYTCLPNGLASAPRIFTRITKVLFSELRKRGMTSVSYIDDCLLISETVEDCQKNVQETVKTSKDAGFTVHPEKSVFVPTQNITYLGFLIDSKTMTVKLPPERMQKLKAACENALSQKTLTIRQLEGVIGLMVASFPGVEMGQLHYRRCDNLKIKALKDANGNRENKVKLNEPVRQDLRWWISNIDYQQKSIVKKPPILVMATDASNTGWGACIQNAEDETGGYWSQDESEMHINYKELLAVWLGIQSLCANIRDEHIKILCDNTTAVAYINNKGGTKKLCNQVARQIWMWCQNNNNFITAAHLPGEKNVRADRASRCIHDNMEWQLNKNLFQHICNKLGQPDIDLFASRLNCQTNLYMSWKPDPGALAIDAMSESWSKYYFYAFPPFNMIGRILQKIELEGSIGILVVPRWHTQPWWPKFQSMCTHPPIVLYRKGEDTLLHHRRSQAELPRMTLLAARVSKRTT